MMDKDMLPQDAPDYVEPPKTTDEEWFQQYQEQYSQAFISDVVDNWDTVSVMSTAELLSLIGDCGNSGTATALNTPFDPDAWRIAAEMANKMAVMAFYVELRYRAIENNIREMEKIDEPEVEDAETDPSRGSESEGVGESVSPRAEQSQGPTGGTEGRGRGSDGPSEQESRGSEGRVGLTEVPKT